MLSKVLERRQGIALSDAETSADEASLRNEQRQAKKQALNREKFADGGIEHPQQDDAAIL